MSSEKPNIARQSEAEPGMQDKEPRLDTAEAQVRNDRFRRIIENTDAGYFRIGMDGRYQDVNPAWLRMHGLTRREDIIGRHYSAVLDSQDIAGGTQNENSDQRLKLRLRTRGDVRMNLSRTTPNGRELNVKRLAGGESAVASAPPPTSGRAQHGSPADGTVNYYTRGAPPFSPL